MCLSNKQTNTRYCLFDRLEKFCLFVWSEVVKRTKQSVQVLFGDHPVLKASEETSFEISEKTGDMIVQQATRGVVGIEYNCR